MNDEREEVLRRLAVEWADALLGASYLPLSRPDTECELAQHLRQLVEAAEATDFTAEPAQRIGEWLVTAHFTSPAALARTLEVLADLPVGRETGEDEAAAEAKKRLAAINGALSEGFSAALVDRVRREQQEIISAALTAREQAESALRQTERRLERAREDFITTISHELKTPLTPIKGYLHTLLQRQDSMTSEQRAHCYRVMLSQAELLTGLVQDLLSAAELQHVGFSVKSEVVEVRDVLQRALEVVPPDSARRFVLTEEGELGLVLCDPVRLQQVLTNLLTNADKYSPPEAPVDVTARRVGDKVEFSVRDHGPGIPPEFRTVVFEPFRRLGTSSQRGAGLGLHIARRLVEAMGGEIWLDPENHPGALFRVTVPAFVEAWSPVGDEPAPRAG